MDMWVLADVGNHRGGFVGQVAGVRVDEGELPLHAQRRTRGTGEADPNRRR